MVNKVNTKHILTSKTFWVSIMMLVGGIISAIYNNYETGATLTVTAIVNIILRVYTKHPVKIKG